MKKIFILICLLIAFYVNSAMSADKLKLATTTSTENSGLLSLLNPPFEQQNNVKVLVIAVGTGAALRLAENGDVDLVFVHAPEAEKKFVTDGFGIERTPVMHNDFVILGPPDDPADLRKTTSIDDVFSQIKDAGANFVSRGDDSGTHKKELQLWKLAEIEPKGKWYFKVGQGMGITLIIAYEKGVYTLSDRGTYLAYQNKINLEIVYENDDALDNPYHIILVNPEKHPYAKFELARKYVDFITGTEGQKIIREFRINGQPLYYPDVIK